MLATIAVAALLQSAARQDTTPRAIIASGQRVTPAGVQSVFKGRVAGVRFGTKPNELWVAAPDMAYRVNFSENRVVSTIAFDGTPGVNGIALDGQTGRVLLASVGRTPTGAPAPTIPGTANVDKNAITRLAAFAENTPASADPKAPTKAVYVTDALADYMAGSPSVARRSSASDSTKASQVRRAIVPLPAGDRVAVIDADRGTVLRHIPLGVLPVASAISADGSVAYVANFGGSRPKPGDRSATECCAARSEPVRVDTRGVADDGNVSRIDLVAGRVTHTITVGRHPGALVWDEAHARVYVVDGLNDAVSVIDSRTNQVVNTILIRPFRERLTGLAPTALALSDDGATLYVALGGVNAVGVYTSAGSFKGLIPSGWYPSSLDVSADGRTLAIGALLGVGSGEGASTGKRGKFVLNVRGSVNVVRVPSSAELSAFTTAVAANNKLTLAGATRAVASMATAAPRPGTVARAVPERPGEPSRIDHVVFIVKENRTYDQVLGDLGRGNGDASLVTYGRDVTPNTHALSEQFVTLDHFFASGGNSADGHQWLTQANESDYVMWPLYFGRSYPSEGNDPLAYAIGGFLWESAQAKGKRVSIFGEFAPAPSDSDSGVRAEFMAKYKEPHDYAASRKQLAARYATKSEIPSLDAALVREYPGWTMETPDVVMADDFLSHLGEWKTAGAMPHLTMMVLPNDHTRGTAPGWCTPKACVADNDLALGKVVEGLSHSPFWKSMAILVVEDDAQNGVDHIDGHRTVALAISPYIKRGSVDSTFYAHPSMVKTVELMLGLPAMTIFDLTATDMRASFIGAAEKPDFTPYTALTPKQSIYETNVRVGDIRGPHAVERRRAALASLRMRFDTPDAAPTEALNRILWHDARGWNTPYPAVKRSLFFPMSVDLADGEREERPKGSGKKRRE